MILSARPKVLSVVIITILLKVCFVLQEFEKSGQTDGQRVKKRDHYYTVGRPNGLKNLVRLLRSQAQL